MKKKYILTKVKKTNLKLTGNFNHERLDSLPTPTLQTESAKKKTLQFMMDAFKDDTNFNLLDDDKEAEDGEGSISLGPLIQSDKKTNKKKGSVQFDFGPIKMDKGLHSAVVPIRRSLDP